MLLRSAALVTVADRLSALSVPSLTSKLLAVIVVALVTVALMLLRSAAPFADTVNPPPDVNEPAILIEPTLVSIAGVVSTDTEVSPLELVTAPDCTTTASPASKVKVPPALTLATEFKVRTSAVSSLSSDATKLMLLSDATTPSTVNGLSATNSMACVERISKLLAASATVISPSLRTHTRPLASISSKLFTRA